MVITTSNGNEYVFENAYGRNRSGFTHDSELRVDGKVFRTHAQYYNRTWEPYPFFSVMCGALYEYRSQIESKLKKDFLEFRGYKRMTSKIKGDFESVLRNDSKLNELEEVRAKLGRM